MESNLLTASAAIVAVDGEPVVVLRAGMLSKDDFEGVQRVCSCLAATVAVAALPLLTGTG